MENLLYIVLGYFPNFSFDNLDPQVIQAIYVFAIVIGVFLLLVLLCFTRHHIIENSLRGFWAGLWTGIIIIGILGGTLFWGARNFLFGEKRALLPPNIGMFASRASESITGVLGISTQREQPTAQSVLTDYKLLSPVDLELVGNTICKPTNKVTN